MSWARTGDYAKVALANRVLFTDAPSLAFTVNLSPKAIAAANDNSKGFVDYFKRRISKELERKLGHHPNYWFAVHSKDGRLHLHGTVEANDNERPRVAAALRVAGGKWDANTGSRRQVDLREHYDPDGWVNYCLVTRNRDFTEAKRTIGTAITITGPLRRITNARYC